MIIGDSSALVALAVMDSLSLLEEIFDEIFVPQAVYDEVSIDNKPQSLKLKLFLVDKIIQVKSDSNLFISQSLIDKILKEVGE